MKLCAQRVNWHMYNSTIATSKDSYAFRGGLKVPTSLMHYTTGGNQGFVEFNRPEANVL